MNYQLTPEELCRKLRPIFGDRIEKLYLKWRMADDMESKREIEQALNALYYEHLSKSLLNDEILLEPPEEKVIEGAYPLGTISYANRSLHPFGLREKDWVRHVCITGMSGSGKTNFAFQIIKDFIAQGKPFMIFDWKKSFRPLIKLDENIMCFTVGDKNVSNLFKININKPPKDVDPKEWLNLLCDLICESFFASYGVHKLLVETVDRTFREFGVYEGSENYPTWEQIKDRLEERAEKTKRKSRETEWLVSTLRIAHALTFGSFGEALNYKNKNAMTIEDLLDKRVIFELSSLNNAEKKFFCEFLLTYIYKYKKKSEKVDGSFNYAILVDEAHNIFLKDRPHFISESVTDMIYREIREYGVGLICLDQHISKLSEVVAGNSACNIAFQQMLDRDIECVSGIMQLKNHKNYFSKLPVGRAIVKLAERFYDPFLIEVPLIGLKDEIVRDETIKNKMKKMIDVRDEYIEFKEDSKVEKLRKGMEEVDKIFKSTGVDTSRSYEEMQETLSRMAQEVVDEDNEEKIKEEIREKKIIQPKGVLMNHIQEYLADYIKKQVERGFSIERIKEHLAKYGYNISDVNKAITHLKTIYGSETEEKIRKEYRIDKQIKEEKVTINEKLQNRNHFKGDNIVNTQLNKNQKILLEFISKNPYFGVSQIYKCLKLSARKGDRLKKELENLGFLRVEEERNSKGWKKLMVPTNAGRSALENPGKLS